MDWTDFLSAVGLVLIFEGFLPFLAPKNARQSFAMLAQLDDKRLRTIGLVALAAGVLVLYAVRG